MQENIVWTLDLPSAKRAMRILSLKIWLLSSLLWGIIVLYLVTTPSNAALHVDGGMFLFLLGCGILFPCSFGLGLRRWLYNDARMIWKDPVKVVAMVQTSATVFAWVPAMFRITKSFNVLMNLYWEERTKAIQEIKNTGQLAEIPQKIQNGKRLSTIDQTDRRLPMEILMTRPLKWYQVILVTILVFLLLGLMIAACPTTTRSRVCYVLLDRHWLPTYFKRSDLLNQILLLEIDSEGENEMMK